MQRITEKPLMGSFVSDDVELMNEQMIVETSPPYSLLSNEQRKAYAKLYIGLIDDILQRKISLSDILRNVEWYGYIRFHPDCDNIIDLLGKTDVKFSNNKVVKAIQIPWQQLVETVADKLLQHKLVLGGFEGSKCNATTLQSYNTYNGAKSVLPMDSDILAILTDGILDTVEPLFRSIYKSKSVEASVRQMAH